MGSALRFSIDKRFFRLDATSQGGMLSVSNETGSAALLRSARRGALRGATAALCLHTA